MKLEYTLIPCTKINSKWLKDLNVRQDTIKLLEENIGKTCSDFYCTNVLLGQSSNATEIKAIINQWDIIKLTSFFTAKETVKKRQSTEWEKNSFKQCNRQGLNLYTKDSYNSTAKNPTIQLKRGKGPELTLLQRRYTDGQQAHEKMLKIPGY